MFGSIKRYGHRKTPGTDGLPCEFYKFFWKDVGETLAEALNFSYQTGKLAVSQRRGIVKLIPKKHADPDLIKNWRPLTLLNCDYKIASKAIANRIKIVSPELLSEDQSGFIKNRCISDNRAVYTGENKPQLTLAAAYIRREGNHLYEYGLY